MHGSPHGPGIRHDGAGLVGRLTRVPDDLRTASANGSPARIYCGHLRSGSSPRRLAGAPMDGSHFDGLTRSLTLTGSRRRAVATLLGGTLAGSLGSSPVDEAIAKKKKPCPACKKRKKRKCKGNQPFGTLCAGGRCDGAGNCKPCVPNCNGRTCGDNGCGGSCGSCSPCQTCTAGTCVTSANNTPCAGGFCQSGVCQICDQGGQFCCQGDKCSGGLECMFNSRCGSCGGVNELCCDDLRCDSGLECGPAMVCIRCGFATEPCCPGSRCNVGLECRNSVCS
jgi:hypothetical protein